MILDIEDLKKVIKKVKPTIEELTSNTSIHDINFSSLDMMILICEVEKQNKKVDIELLKKTNTLGELCNAIIE